MTRQKAVEQLQRTAFVVFRGCAIWEVEDLYGYTGRYRVSPAGLREQFKEARDVTQAFKLAREIIARRKQK